jgi:hypothetical protein
MKKYTIPVQKYVIYTVRDEAQNYSAHSANSLTETLETTPGVP